MFIGIHEPHLNLKTKKNVLKCIDSNWISTSGEFLKKLSLFLERYLKVKYVLLTNSGTSALDLAIKSLEPQVNNEIIVPTVTFVSPINAVLYNKCLPVFMDCDDYLNIDIIKIINFLKKNTFTKKNKNKISTYNKKTKNKILAIIVTHVFGNAANIEKLISICKAKRIKIIEDAAESFGTKYIKGNLKKKFTGTIGDIGCISFNGNKIVSSGSGGALLTNNSKCFKLAKHLCFQSKKDPSIFAHDQIGYNYGMTNLSAALCYNQAITIEYLIKKKKKIKNYYEKYLKYSKNGVLLSSPRFSRNNNWINIFKFNFHGHSNIDKILNKFRKNKIQVRKVWLPNHMQVYLKKYQKFDINKARQYKYYLCLPSSSFLKKETISKISKILS